MHRLSFLSVAVVLGMAINVQASIVDLTFSGNYEGGVSLPFSYSMTYDTSLDTNTEFFATGVNLGGETTTHEWHGYSASGITDVDFHLSELEWLLSDLDHDRTPAAGTTADLWFDVDLATGATPTLAWFSFTTSSLVVLEIGGRATEGNDIYMRDVSQIFYSGGIEVEMADSVTITRSDPAPIPEPASVITWTLLGVVGCIATWWNRRRKAS